MFLVQTPQLHSRTASSDMLQGPAAAPLPPQPFSGPSQNSPIDDFHPRNVYVAGLPSNFTDAMLLQYFTRFGTVESAKIMHATARTTDKRVGFVLFADPIAAQNAVASNGAVIDSSVLTVRKARISPPPAKQRAAQLQQQIGRSGNLLASQFLAAPATAPQNCVILVSAPPMAYFSPPVTMAAAPYLTRPAAELMPAVPAPQVGFQPLPAPFGQCYFQFA